MKRKEFSISEDCSSFDVHTSDLLDSDLGVLVERTFGQQSLKTIFSSDPLSKEVTQKSVIQNTNVWVSSVLEGINPPLSMADEDNRPGRLGIPQVRFDSTTQVGTFLTSPDGLHLQALSNFSSVRSNVCCFSGKWQYELQLESKGVMQLGWTMSQGDFTLDSGVGDTIYSFAYDGNRVRKWNLVTTEYGEAWQTGDIIGCTIDLDVGSIHFYRNGKDLGEAFSFIPMGPGCVYYAAISLAYEERCLANFGSTPFKFPVKPYLPLQQPPIGAIIRTNQLLYWLSCISSVPAEKLSVKEQSADLTKSSPEAVTLLLAEILMTHLSVYLTKPYVVDDCLIPFFHEASMAGLEKNNFPDKKPLVKINFFFDSLALFFESEDCKEVINAICKCLVHKFNQTAVSLDYDTQKYSLGVLSDICQNLMVRKTLLKQPDFVKLRIPQFMDVKPIDTISLKQCVPQSWWESKEHPTGKSEDTELMKQAYLANCETIKNKTLELEHLQEEFLVELLNNEDGTATEASSRKYFLHMFRLFLKDNHITGLNNETAELTPLPRALNVFHRLVNVLRHLYKKELQYGSASVSASIFYSGLVDFFTIDRLGGVMSHLLRTLRPAIIEELGAGHEAFVDQPTATPTQPTVPVQVRAMDTSTGASSRMPRWFYMLVPVRGQVTETPGPEVVDPSSVSSCLSLKELLDGTVMLYSLAAHKQLHKISTLRDEMDKYIQALNETKKKKKLAEAVCPEAAEQMEISIQAFERKIEEQSQVLMAWVRGAVYTPEKRANLVWLLDAVLNTLIMPSHYAKGLLGFVPEYYLDTLVEICSALRHYFNPTLPLEELTGYKHLLQRVAEFLANYFCDPRIVNPHSKDVMVEAIGSFVAKKLTLECFENISVESQERFVRLLLKPYEDQPWGQVNWILMRMWQGDGFAFRYHMSPHLRHKLSPRTPFIESGLLVTQAFEPCPSSYYQQLVARILSEDQETAVVFLNSVLKQLNWTFSEFISMLQEIQNLAKKPERVIIDARQLKVCVTCYDLVIALLRVVEMLCSVCLHVFTDASREGTENLLERLCQLLSQILLRLTSPRGTFSHVISMEVPDLEAIDQFPVLTAVAGIIAALLAEDLSIKDNNMTTDMSSVARCLLSESSFNIDNLKYLIGESENNVDKKERFSFEKYPEAVSVAEVQTLRRVIHILSQYKANMSMTMDLEDEELCPICCAMPLTATFIPCQHQSCKSCITHYLMDCKECFFCKAAISSVVTKDGRILFDNSASSQQTLDDDQSHQC